MKIEQFYARHVNIIPYCKETLAQVLSCAFCGIFKNILHSNDPKFLLGQLDVELTVFKSAQNPNYKGFCFLFVFNG